MQIGEKSKIRKLHIVEEISVQLSISQLSELQESYGA